MRRAFPLTSGGNIRQQTDVVKARETSDQDPDIRLWRRVSDIIANPDRIFFQKVFVCLCVRCLNIVVQFGPLTIII
jgi:hypothetical protein